MNYAIKTTDDFENDFRRLFKKYRSLYDDVKTLKNELLINPLMGDDLGDNTRKVRMGVASKNKGKSGGARIITCHVLIDVENTKIYLLTMYDKGEKENISKREIKYLKEKYGLA